MFRLIQVIDLLIFFPMLILGLMVGLSGGGLNPWAQKLGGIMFRFSPMCIVSVIVAEFAWRFNLELIAYGLVLTPIVVWLCLLIVLQKKTRFFFQKKR